MNILSVLAELYTFVPQNACVLNVNMDSSGKIELAVFVEDEDAIINGLKQSTYLKNVKVTSSDLNKVKLVCYYGARDY